jgi:hypothetical protein
MVETSKPAARTITSGLARPLDTRLTHFPIEGSTAWASSRHAKTTH